MDHADCIVIGAGVIGLACARKLAQQGRDVLIIEAEKRFGTGVSSRSSEVIHGGLYYPAGSLKATLCIRGKMLLYEYCAEHAIPHRRCGKLLVACAGAQQNALEQITGQARINGVDDLQALSAAQAKRFEPALRCTAALLSPSTGILDSHKLMLSLLGDAERHGATLVCNTVAEHLEYRPNAPLKLTVREAVSGARHRLSANAIVNAAGLDAIALARRFDGLDGKHIPIANFVKGSYFSLRGHAPFSRLIYPLPQRGGLGIHLTLDLHGSARFGPDVEWLTPPENAAAIPEGAPYPLEPALFDVDASRRDAFINAIRHYWPELPAERLQPGYAGIRPKIHGADENGADFRIDGTATHGIPGLINLFGIESPGLTASLAIAEHVSTLLRQA